VNRAVAEYVRGQNTAGAVGAGAGAGAGQMVFAPCTEGFLEPDGRGDHVVGTYACNVCII